MYDTVLLLSGGLDSTVLAYDLAARGKRIRALYFDLAAYPSIQEIHAVKRACFDLRLPLEIVELRGLIPMSRGFVPERLAAVDEKDIKASDRFIVPNATGFPILLATAAYYAQVTKINHITLGIIGEQSRHRPGIRSFLDSFSELTASLREELTRVTFDTPFAQTPKAQIVEKGHDLRVPLDRTWTCFYGGTEHCGKCPGCDERRKAFAAANMQDPTAYASESSEALPTPKT